MQRRNVFAGPYLDREAAMRDDPEWFQSALADPSSRVVPLWNLRSLVTLGEHPRAVLVELGAIPPDKRNGGNLILLGRYAGAWCFTCEIESTEPPVFKDGSHFEELRVVASLLPADDAGLLGYARALFFWRHRHRFCGTCGAATLPAKAGHVLICTNSECSHEQFPRLDPAIIVLISDGEKALLGRQASWPTGRYSTIAGFVEPGESLEDAVAREVFEETGVEVDAIEYHSSQPWPFPASLMLGFTAHAVTHEIHLRDQELEDARWFTREDITAARVPVLLPSQSISFRLIEQWFDAGSERSLREIHGIAPPAQSP